MQKNGLFKRVGRARQDKSVSCIPEPLLLARILQLTKHTTTHRRGLHSVQVFAEKMGQEDPLKNIDRFSPSPCWVLANNPKQEGKRSELIELKRL